ncbi:TIGR03759 family integrating conjugative element protein [Avibacterium paragallinarum]|uniref:TIGR03759 family integrating conjugative element protein n=1 Tax=Avibacterium paragallinarum TaxID=728 RepID=UPI001C999627|nr:TIGR03759 family integrating conjugative element protein [Avibacterium paragallinarum]QZP16385.1 TIGR03759 family integrating conjugative element protein [Avibacterium paragallinarum]
MNKLAQWVSLSILGIGISFQGNADSLTHSSSLLSATSSHTTTLEKQLDTHTLTQSELQQKAQEWGLSTEEWQRYLELQKGERGIWSPNLDPLTTLGIEAKTEEERTRYAELLARKMYERVERELAFQRAYDKAFAKLYPNELPFEVEPHISQSAGRVLYFTRLDNCAKCEADVSRILSHVGNSTPVDIYIVGGNDNAIREWAKKHHIDPIKVKKRLITLNHDTGYWLQYAKGKMPAAFQIQQDGQWQSLVY